MNNPDPAAVFPAGESHDLPREPVTGEFAADYEAPAVDGNVAYTNLGFIAAALRRSAWLWCFTAVAGLIIGYGLYGKFPPSYQATTSVYLTNNSRQDPQGQVQTNVALAQSQAVAGRVVKQLGLHQSVPSFIAAYSVTYATDQVLTITVAAPSSNDAVRRASALATDFLQFRAQMLLSQQRLEVTTFDQQIMQAQQRLNSIDEKISQMPAQPASAAERATFGDLQTQADHAGQALSAIELNASSSQASTQVTTETMVKGTDVLNPATVIPRSFRQGKAYYLAVMLIVGLALGMAIVIIRALVSSRLRRRDDVADAMGAPVKLSVASLGARGWMSMGRGATRSARDMRCVITHLSGAVPRSSRSPAGLAVVAVDDAEIAARAVVSLAESCASQGRQVVIADLSDGIAAARLLGVKHPGVETVSVDGASLVVAVPDRDEVAPVGPLTGSSHAERAQVGSALAASCASADLLLTLATLDPAKGADHLATWATDVVAMVTAGRSSATRVHAVGEMIRLAGTRLVSVVLLGADKHDESLGVTHVADQSTSMVSI